MNPSDVRNFRLAAFQTDIVNSVCWAILEENRWEVRTAVNHLVKIVDRNQRLLNLHENASFHPTDSHAARLQTMILWLIDEMRLVQFGSNRKYYPPNAYVTVVENIRKIDSDLYPISDMLEALMPFWQNGLFLTTRSRSVDDDSSDIASRESAWRDISTEEFHECVELLLFASSDEWEERSGQLAQLAPRIAADPSLSLSIKEADDIAWGLQGADFIFDHSNDGIQWSTTFSTIQWDFFSSPNSRPRRLEEIRNRIAESARLLTPDQSTAATRRLTSIIEDPEGRSWTT